MKPLSFLGVLFVLSFSKILADINVYFDYALSSNVFKSNTEVFVRFDYLLEGYTPEDFSVRPKFSSGEIEIYNSLKEKWVTSSSPWADMPILDETVSIRIKIPAYKTEDIYFLIHNRVTGEVYKTKIKKVFPASEYGRYIYALNNNLSISTRESKMGTNTDNTYQYSGNNIVDYIKIILLILLIPESWLVLLIIKKSLLTTRGKIT